MLSQADNYLPEHHIVVLFEKPGQLAAVGLSPIEIGYVEKSVTDKKREIALNRFTHWVIAIQASEGFTDAGLEKIRRSGAIAQGILADQKLEKVQITDLTGSESGLFALTMGICLANYRFTRYYKDAQAKESPLKNIEVIGLSGIALEQLRAIVQAVYTVRDWVNEPAASLTSVKFATELETLAADVGLTFSALDKKAIEGEGMGGLLAVNQGSTLPPFLVQCTWQPTNAVNTKPIVLVGKGVIYDTGGLSLKGTEDSMDYMKCDMAGAATMAGVMATVARLGLPVYIISLMPVTDNRLSAASYAPGDIIRMHNGLYVEVANTDAEGRMILADALSYASRFDPELIINMATLTGSASAAIGNQGVVVMGTAADEVFALLEKAGYREHERVVRFPLWEEYADLIKSDVADMKNVGGRQGGAIIGGKFLERFVSAPFIHIDIAGVAFSKQKNSYRGKGGTAMGLRLLYRFITDYISAAQRQ